MQYHIDSSGDHRNLTKPIILIIGDAIYFYLRFEFEAILLGLWKLAEVIMTKWVIHKYIRGNGIDGNVDDAY
jgi:hypothetical protein